MNRYEVCSIVGDSFPERGSSQTIWIADSWYGYREAWSRTNRTPRWWKRDRAHAAVRCEKLNAEHDAWMRDNGYTSSVYRSVDTVDSADTVSAATKHARRIVATVERAPPCK